MAAKRKTKSNSRRPGIGSPILGGGEISVIFGGPKRPAQKPEGPFTQPCPKAMGQQRRAKKK